MNTTLFENNVLLHVLIFLWGGGGGGGNVAFETKSFAERHDDDHDDH